jgi:2'-5' RNA ligase
MRSFIGIMVDEPMQQFVQQLMAKLRLRPYADNIRWSNLKNLHITLQFLEHISSEQLRYLLQYMPIALNKVIVFSLSPHYFELFPMADRPVVIALRFKPEAKLDHLADMIKTVAIRAGIAVDPRPFQAHLTLGRIKKQPYPVIDDIMIPGNLRFSIKQVTLVESRPQAGGSLYLPIKHLNLAEN